MSKIDYQQFTLDNGLKVVVHEDHSVPKAVVDVIYRVGSKDEEPHRTGFAHLFEHLMFRGSKHIPSYDSPLQRAGGQNNAFTTADVTNYYLSIPSGMVETGFWLESDRMLELALTEEKLEAEKSVVIEEFKQRYLNQPYGDAHLKLRGLHFQKHPYHWATIGKEMSHITDATLEDVKEFFYGYYAPNNATLIVAGDVSYKQVKKLAQKWFGPIPRRELKKHALPQEPQQTEARSMTAYGDVPFPAVYKMYHIPPHEDRGYYIADIITDIFTNGRNARLFRRLVKEQQVASSISAYPWMMHDPGALSIDARISTSSSIEAYEKALQAEIDDLENLTQGDLDRMKTKLESIFLLNQTTILNKAMGLALSDVLGDIDLVNTTPDLYQSITLEEVKTAAKAIFAPTNCSTLYYLPQEK
jgi:predicted Zn-dependent peptidase